ncbi:unnamed protein product [Amoebophrya sp. A120]|nr:unnamed protein product [Amoebophrya sp. A120]|eukprot:GSA120T00001104001.1
MISMDVSFRRGVMSGRPANCLGFWFILLLLEVQQIIFSMFSVPTITMASPFVGGAQLPLPSSTRFVQHQTRPSSVSGQSVAGSSCSTCTATRATPAINYYLEDHDPVAYSSQDKRQQSANALFQYRPPARQPPNPLLSRSIPSVSGAAEAQSLQDWKTSLRPLSRARNLAPTHEVSRLLVSHTSIFSTTSSQVSAMEREDLYNCGPRTPSEDRHFLKKHTGRDCSTCAGNRDRRCTTSVNVFPACSSRGNRADHDHARSQSRAPDPKEASGCSSGASDEPFAGPDYNATGRNVMLSELCAEDHNNSAPRRSRSYSHWEDEGGGSREEWEQHQLRGPRLDDSSSSSWQELPYDEEGGHRPHDRVERNLNRRSPQGRHSFSKKRSAERFSRSTFAEVYQDSTSDDAAPIGGGEETTEVIEERYIPHLSPALRKVYCAEPPQFFDRLRQYNDFTEGARRELRRLVLNEENKPILLPGCAQRSDAQFISSRSSDQDLSEDDEEQDIDLLTLSPTTRAPSQSDVLTQCDEQSPVRGGFSQNRTPSSFLLSGEHRRLAAESAAAGTRLLTEVEGIDDFSSPSGQPAEDFAHVESLRQFFERFRLECKERGLANFGVDLDSADEAAGSKSGERGDFAGDGAQELLPTLTEVVEDIIEEQDALQEDLAGKFGIAPASLDIRKPGARRSSGRTTAAAGGYSCDTHAFTVEKLKRKALHIQRELEAQRERDRGIRLPKNADGLFGVAPAYRKKPFNKTAGVCKLHGVQACSECIAEYNTEKRVHKWCEACWHLDQARAEFCCAYPERPVPAFLQSYRERHYVEGCVERRRRRGH